MSANRQYSLTRRVLLASLLFVPLFLGGTGWYLERSYEKSLESAVEERLHLQVLTLMAEADYDTALLMPEAQLEARFNQVNSGLFGLISDAQGKVLWRSRSSVASDAELLTTGQLETQAGERGFRQSDALYQAWYAVSWQTESGVDVPLVFSVLETAAPTQAQLASLRSSLILWLGGATLALLLLQVGIVVWGLRPLRTLASDIAQVESGKQDRLVGHYPREVEPVTRNLNSLLQSEAKRRERTRNTLADLAHSLKTPLAVMRNADASASGFAQQVRSQSDQMESIIDYQLQRATGEGHTLLRLIPIAPVAKRLADTLRKVYADKAMTVEVSIEDNTRFRGDERDLMELLGNLMDNACKYGRTRVRVSANNSVDDNSLRLFVDDDGAGINPTLRETLLARGARADQTQPGQGIGLAVAADIARSYAGNVALEESELGGCRVVVELGDIH